MRTFVRVEDSLPAPQTPFHDSLSREAAANNIQNRIPFHKEGKLADVTDQSPA